MQVIPLQNYVVCRKYQDGECTKEVNGIYTKVDQVPIYQIELISVQSKDNLGDLRLTIGDLIITNSTGTKVKLDNSSDIQTRYLFSIENIMARIVE